MAEDGYELFKRQVASNSVIEIVLRSHLLIEDRLLQALNFLLPHPDYLKLDRMGFYNKVNLCAALGHITEYELKAVLAFNGLRNKIAHQLDTEITLADVQKIVGHFDAELQSKFKPSERDEQEPVRYLRLIVSLLYLQVSLVTGASVAARIEEIERQAKLEALNRIAEEYRATFAMQSDRDLEPNLDQRPFQGS